MSNSTRRWPRHTLRWGVPVAVVAAIALVGSGVLSAGATPQLPDLSAAQLLVAVQQAHVDGFSGEVVENAALGLPQLPSLGNGGSNTSLTALLSGSHTSRIWYAGPTKQRFALLGTLGETDVFHDGTQLWQWDSDTKTAIHTKLPADAAKEPPATTQSTLTPQQLAQQALAAIDPSTVVATGQTRQVAGRDAYELVLSPRDATSRIGSIRIAIDAVNKIPLSVQIYARGASGSPAIDISFTSIDFSVPANSEFAFTPPKSANVREEGVGSLLDGGLSGPGGDRHLPRPGSAATGAPASAPAGGVTSGSAPKVSGGSEPQVLGHGWTSVIEVHGGAPSAGSSDPQTQALLGALAPVSGSWGSGRLFSSKLVTALFTDDGRIFAGAVDPSVLYADAAAHH